MCCGSTTYVTWALSDTASYKQPHIGGRIVYKDCHRYVNMPTTPPIDFATLVYCILCYRFLVGNMNKLRINQNRFRHRMPPYKLWQIKDGCIWSWYFFFAIGSYFVCYRGNAAYKSNNRHYSDLLFFRPHVLKYLWVLDAGKSSLSLWWWNWWTFDDTQS